MSEKLFSIQEQTVNEIYTYLSKQPYAEVALLVRSLGMLLTLKDPEVVDIKKNEKKIEEAKKKEK